MDHKTEVCSALPRPPKMWEQARCNWHMRPALVRALSSGRVEVDALRRYVNLRPAQRQNRFLALPMIKADQYEQRQIVSRL